MLSYLVVLSFKFMA